MGEYNSRMTPNEFMAFYDAVGQISAALRGNRDLAVDVTGVTIRGPREAGDEILLVVRGIGSDGGPVVAFHSAYGLAEALLSLAARLNNGSLKWREDEFARK